MKIVKKAMVAIPTLMLIFFLALVVHISISMQKHKVPTVFGYSFHIVATGSMEPELLIGDFAVSKSKKTYYVGETVSFYYDYDLDGVKESMTHKIIEKDGTTYTLHGVAAPENQIQVVQEDDIYGKVVYSSSFFGKVFSGKWIGNKQILFLIISVGLGIFAIVQFVGIVKIVKEKEE